VLTAPDSSSLKVFYHGDNIGFCHWTTSVGEDLAKLKDDALPPEGMIERVTNYRIQLEGNVAVKDLRNRARFDCQLKLTTNQVWQEFNLRLTMRPAIWEVHCVAAEKKVHIKVEDEDGGFDRVFHFAELQTPDGLVSELLGPSAYLAISSLGLLDIPRNGSVPASSLKWDARNDIVRIGPATIRAYRLQAVLMDRFTAVLYISRVGEILRVELPNGIVLANDQLSNL
jgi:hypothetical protein